MREQSRAKVAYFRSSNFKHKMERLQIPQKSDMPQRFCGSERAPLVSGAHFVHACWYVSFVIFLFTCFFANIKDLRKACKNIHFSVIKNHGSRLVGAVHYKCNPKWSSLKGCFLLIPLFYDKIKSILEKLWGLLIVKIWSEVLQRWS